MYMFKIDAILSLFAIFNNFTSLYVFFSYTSDMNGKCIKSLSKFVRKMVFMFMRHL
jgi:small neutral amino acid transporter SnatA (MarC family)